MKNKLTKMVMAAVLIVPVLFMPTAVEAAVKDPFKDVSKNSPYVEIVHEMRDSNIISGYANGEFRPEESITRKHAAALVNRAVKLPARQPFVQFKDVSKKNAYFNDIKKLQQAGIFEADAKGNLYPNKPITRAEMAKVLTIAFKLDVQTELNFVDVPRSHPANEYVRALYSNGITTGDNGKYLPNKPVTRVHYAVFLHRTLHMNDPVDPTELAKPLKGQLGVYTEEQMEWGNTEYVAYQMKLLLAQKVTRYPEAYRLPDSNKEAYGKKREIDMNSAGSGYSQMAKENILYLKRFVKKGSELDMILERWDAGDFSNVKNEYVRLVGIADPEYFVWCLEDKCLDTNQLHVWREQWEEFYIRTVFGQKGLNLHREQWGTKEQEPDEQENN